MERHVEAMTGKELAEEFKIMVHNFVHMGELPHERVSWAVGLAGPDGGEWAEAYINHCADVLLRLSNEVRRAGQEALQRNQALRRDGKSEQGNRDTDGK